MSFPSGTSNPDRNKNFRMSPKEQREKGQRQQPWGDSGMRVGVNGEMENVHHFYINAQNTQTAIFSSD